MTTHDKRLMRSESTKVFYLSKPYNEKYSFWTQKNYKLFQSYVINWLSKALPNQFIVIGK